MSLRIFRLLVVLLLLIIFLQSFAYLDNNSKAVIRLNPEEKFQTMIGWEAVGTAADEAAPDSFPLYKDTLIAAAMDLGINRVRVGIPPYVENPVDQSTVPRPRNDSSGPHKEAINDDDDPFHINEAGFTFRQLDSRIEKVVLPLKQLLESRGEHLFLNICFVDFRNKSKFKQREQPEEYAEFVLAVYLHLKKKFGIVPDAWEMCLEPDLAGWGETGMSRAIIATGKRLSANGLRPYLIAPSTTDMKRAVSYLDKLMSIPGVADYLSEFSFHRYKGFSPAVLKSIADRAARYRVPTSMLEYIGADYETLHEDLKIGMVSAWEQYTLAWLGRKDDGGKYFIIDLANPKKPKIEITKRAKLLRQYFKFIRRDAVRIGASSDDPNFDPLAFINKNGKYVVVIKAGKGGPFSVNGLPPGTFGVKYSTLEKYDQDAVDQSIKEDQLMNASIPEKGVITIYQK